MKTATIYRFVLVIAVTGVLFSCNKSNSSSNNSSSSTSLQTNSDDETRVSTETDAGLDDVNTAMTAQYNVTGAATAREMLSKVLDGPGGGVDSGAICDGTITLDTTSNPHTIIITYNGTNCALDRTRTGSIVVSWPAGQLWRTAGAVVTVQFDNLAITRIADNKTITINGTHTYTNVSGGSLISLPNNPGASITHSISSSNMQVTFDNASKRTWNVARQRVFTYNGGYVISTSGTHTDDSTTGISEWGTDRFGTSFEVAIVQPRVITESCGWQMTAGQVALSNTLGTTTITYGLNASGASTGCPVGGATYYFALAWTAATSGKTYSFILPY